MALPLSEDRHQHMCARHLLAAHRLHMDDDTLEGTLEARGRL